MSSDCLTAINVYVCSVVFLAPVLLRLPSSALTDQAGSGGMTAERPVIRGVDGRIPGPAFLGAVLASLFSGGLRQPVCTGSVCMASEFD